jgi:hypothetical protein
MCDRVCTKCGESHPATFFNKDRTRADGVYPQCKNCSREAGRRNYEKHLIPHRELKRAWKEANRERHREQSLAWQKVNRDKARAATAKWQAALKAATPPWANKKAIQAFYKQRPFGHHVDHIEPLQGWDRCGLNVIWNLQYLPATTHRKKGNRTGGEAPYMPQVSLV